MPPPSSILIGGNRRRWRTILSKSTQAKDNFNIETSSKPGKGWATSIAFCQRRSALGNLPESPTSFPVSTYVKRVLGSSIRSFFLDSLRMREASSLARRGEGIAQDGSNLPWVIKRLKEEHPGSYEEWLSHVQTTLPDLACVGVVERQDDRHAYLRLRYRSGVEIPSWMASDGALRLLALTLPAYLPASDAIYLLEEPENRIHPLAVDCVFESLSSVYDSQVLLATHSPVVLRMAAPPRCALFCEGYRRRNRHSAGRYPSAPRGLAGLTQSVCLRRHGRWAGTTATLRCGDGSAAAGSGKRVSQNGCERRKPQEIVDWRPRQRRA